MQLLVPPYAKLHLGLSLSYDLSRFHRGWNVIKSDTVFIPRVKTRGRDSTEYQFANEIYSFDWERRWFFRILNSSSNYNVNYTLFRVKSFLYIRYCVWSWWELRHVNSILGFTEMFVERIDGEKLAVSTGATYWPRMCVLKTVEGHVARKFSGRWGAKKNPVRGRAYFVRRVFFAWVATLSREKLERRRSRMEGQRLTG